MAVRAGESAMFECHIAGPPDVDVDWLSNGKLIQPALLNCKMHFDGKRCVIKCIRRMDDVWSLPPDRGVQPVHYLCSVSDSGFKKKQLRIRGKKTEVGARTSRLTSALAFS